MEKNWGKKRWYKYLIQLMVVALIVTSIPLNGLAETAPPFTPSPNSEQSPEVETKEGKRITFSTSKSVEEKQDKKSVKPN